MSEHPPLPEKVVQISTIRAVRMSGRTCRCPHPRFEIDLDAREVTCRLCEHRVEPFDALQRMCFEDETYAREFEELVAQRRELLDWEPHLVVLRELQRVLLSKHEVATCPHCKRGLLTSDFAHMGRCDREFEVRLRRRELEAARASAPAKDGGAR